MTPAPRINPDSHDAPRATMSLPNVYFNLNCPFVTIIGMYANVPEHGSIESVQQQWLTNECATAPQDKALIQALHHPVYSFDGHHSGSPQMADVVQHAINDSRRVPNMVLTAHAHKLSAHRTQHVAGTQTPFLVIGNGGYFHLHGMNITSLPTGKAAPHTNHGYATLTVDAENISGVVTTIDEQKYPGSPAADKFSYPFR
jgi:hypothetical protein